MVGNTRGRLTICLVGVLAIGLTVSAWWQNEIKKIWALATKSTPVYEGPSYVDLGSHEEGQIAETSFWVANRGGGQLIIDHIQSSCSCAGLEWEIDAQRHRAETITLNSGEKVKFFARVSVRGPVNQPFRNSIHFRTNDPLVPEGMIELLVPNITGGASVHPSGIAFGQVPVGAHEIRLIDVLDRRSPPRSITKISTTNDKIISTRVLPVADKNSTIEAGARLIGKIEVSIKCDSSRVVQEKVYVTIDQDARPLEVPVSGEVQPPVEVYPKSLTLPRSASGGLIYHSQCLCRSVAGTPLDLTVESAPLGLVVRIEESKDSPAERLVRIEWDQSKDEPGVPEVREVRLVAKWADKQAKLVIPVDCRIPGGAK